MDFGGLDLKGALTFLFAAGAGLSVVIALVIYATNKWGGGDQGGLADARMMGCIMAAIAFSAAAVLVQALNLNYGG